MKEDAQKMKLEYLLNIISNLYGLGMNEQDRRSILVFISRLINLKDAEMVNQFVEELKELEGESNMWELTWLEEYFRDGEARGEDRGRSEMLNAAINFMRSNGMSKE